MTVWRYTAVSLPGAGGTGRGEAADGAPARRTGELAAETSAEVRASLRRIGFQVVDVRPVRRPTGRSSMGRAKGRSAARERGRGGDDAGATGSTRDDVASALRERWHAYTCARRRDRRAELYDGLATMLGSGVPLLEAVETVLGSAKRAGSPFRWMLLQLREGLRSGHSLSEAMDALPGWFSADEVAMVRAGQHSGNLDDVLRALSDRHQRSGELMNRLVGALAYPLIVSLVGLGVVIFLSVKTLPELVQVLADAGLEAPAITVRVMAIGQTLAAHGVWIALAAVVGAVTVGSLIGAASRRNAGLPRALRRLHPRVLRRMAVASFSLQLAQMLRSGVPIVEGLRVLAPTAGGPMLRRRLVDAADRVERGAELSAALDDEHWFDAEFRRLLDIGQASGELDALLERLGERYARQSRRLIDRTASLLEPAVILVLATLVGIVVMAAVLPLLRLQEIL